MSLIDSHAHLDSDRYEPDELTGILHRAYANDVRAILAIGIGDGPATMHRALDIAHQYTGIAKTPTIFASAGIHPDEAANADGAALAKLKGLAADQRCLAIGEIGLDYYHASNPCIEIQQQAFLAQMQLAVEAGLPIIIHCRASEISEGAAPESRKKFGGADAWNDTLALIEEHFASHNLGGIMHCFGGSLDHARRSLAMGFYLSFAGNMTYPKAQTIRDAAIFAPLDRILVETDAPFLAPIPHRGKRNESAFVRDTALRLADLRNITEDELAAATTQNFLRLFTRARGVLGAAGII